MNLVKQRNEWYDHYVSGGLPSSKILELYRKNRDSEHWRASREVEELCEYILYLEINQRDH